MDNKKTESFELAFAYPEEAERAKKEQWPILIPIGTMEYHSDHCPYGCDTLVSIGMAKRFAQEVNCVLMPPIFYGVSSYAVAGPESNTLHVDCDTIEQYVYSILKSLFRAGFRRNIFFIISHQTEDYNPMELACRKAARKLTFEYLEETGGYGWWGKRENKDFYESMTGKDNPWNWVRFLHGCAPEADAKYGSDHAGVYECSQLEALYPGSILLDRLGRTDDWFAESAKDTSAELGEAMIAETLRVYLPILRGE